MVPAYLLILARVGTLPRMLGQTRSLSFSHCLTLSQPCAHIYSGVGQGVVVVVPRSLLILTHCYLIILQRAYVYVGTLPVCRGRSGTLGPQH